jgi:hypothetical protein
MIHENLRRLWLNLERDIEDSAPGTIAECLVEIQNCDLLSYGCEHVSSLTYYLDQEAGAGRQAMLELAIGAACRFGQSCQWDSKQRIPCRCLGSTALGIVCVAGIAGEICGADNYSKEVCWYIGMQRACNQGTDEQPWRPLASKFIENVYNDMSSWSIFHVELHRAIALGALAQILLAKTPDAEYMRVYKNSMNHIDIAADKADIDDESDPVGARSIAQQIRDCVEMLGMQL